VKSYSNEGTDSFFSIFYASSTTYGIHFRCHGFLKHTADSHLAVYVLYLIYCLSIDQPIPVLHYGIQHCKHEIQHQPADVINKLIIFKNTAVFLIVEIAVA
jgi:hypothetical protein